MAWVSITASQTDANSPLNQVLMDGIRGDLEYLHSVGSAMKYLNVRINQNVSIYDGVLNSELDWRDRYVEVQGVVLVGSIAQLDALELGGAGDNKIGNQAAPAACADIGKFFDWFYTAAGSSGRSVLPYLVQAGTSATNFYIWVDSSNGNLRVSINTPAVSNYRNILAHVRLIYSEDQGGH